MIQTNTEIIDRILNFDLKELHNLNESKISLFLYTNLDTLNKEFNFISKKYFEEESFSNITFRENKFSTLISIRQLIERRIYKEKKEVNSLDMIIKAIARIIIDDIDLTMKFSSNEIRYSLRYLLKDFSFLKESDYLLINNNLSVIKDFCKLEYNIILDSCKILETLKKIINTNTKIQ